MKLSIDRQEKKGFFGGSYYESYIQLTLTPEEEKVAKKIGLMNQKIFYFGWSEQDKQVLLTLQNLGDSTQLKFEELTRGITAKCKGDMDLNRLAFTEDMIRQKCKEIKAAIENYISNKNALEQGKYEEEI